MKNRLVVVFLFIAIIIVSLFIAFKSADFRAFSADNSLIIKSKSFKPDLSANNFSEPGLKKKSYSMDISGQLLNQLEGNQYEIIFNRLSDNAHAIYFNEVLIGKYGDFKNGNSNLWNGIFTYPLSANLIQDQNTLRIDTIASYRSGLSSDSIYITAMDNLNSEIGTIRFYGENFNTIMIGFIFFSSLITLFFYYINGKEDKKYLYASIATFMTGIYFSDYLIYSYIGLPYLLYKKFVIGSLFIGVGFYAYVIGAYFNNRWIKFLGNITIVSILVMGVFAPNMVVFKQWYTYGYFLILLNVFAWLWFSIKNIHKRFVAFIFSIGFMAMGIYGGITIWMDIDGSYFQFNSPIFYISVFSAIPLLLIYEAIHEKELLLVKEKSLREKEFINSMTDSLTSAWNQRYMSMIFHERLGRYSMALIDIDNFKHINDTYGHLTGDFVLIGVSKLLSNALSEDDIICRYGGDEFVIIVKDKGIKDSFDFFEDLRKQVEAYQFEYDKNLINVTISIGLIEEKGSQTVEYVFNCVDELLYKSKENGKNKTSIQVTI